MSDSASIKAIQQRMQQVRHDLGDEVGELVESAKDMTDWRMYVRANPWLCMAAAAAMGYIVVPKRPARLKLNQSDLQALTRHATLSAPAGNSQRGGLRKALVSFVTSAALRAAMSYLKQRAVSAAVGSTDDFRSKQSRTGA